MTLDRPDVAQIRLDNAMALFAEFVRHAAKNPDAATLRGLERRFAEQLQIQPSYWSQIKSRARLIGERLARQFEALCHKPHGWMDVSHASVVDALLAKAAAAKPVADPDSGLPQNDDERFIVGLVLSYYRRHPAKARSRLLDILGEVLVPPAVPQAAPVAVTKPGKTATPKPGAVTQQSAEHSLWLQANKTVAPLKRKP
jgi:hypothetical protein